MALPRRLVRFRQLNAQPARLLVQLLHGGGIRPAKARGSALGPWPPWSREVASALGRRADVQAAPVAPGCSRPCRAFAFPRGRRSGGDVSSPVTIGGATVLHLRTSAMATGLRHADRSRGGQECRRSRGARQISASIWVSTGEHPAVEVGAAWSPWPARLVVQAPRPSSSATTTRSQRALAHALRSLEFLSRSPRPSSFPPPSARSRSRLRSSWVLPSSTASTLDLGVAMRAR